MAKSTGACPGSAFFCYGDGMAQLLNTLPRELLATAGNLLKGIPGSEIYLVGGAVRDQLLNRPTKDYDLVVRNVEAAKLEGWLGSNGQVSLVGKTFGVFKWQPEGWLGEAIDVALPRTEHVSSGTGQYRDFNVQSNPKLPIQDDLLRRDFTVNALALNLGSGEIIDPSQGKHDLKEKKLRTVGEPATRFSEDLSRTLRGIRFACQLKFAFEPETWAGIKQLSHQAAGGKINDDFLVPREVVAREILKSLIANPAQALELLDDSGFLAELMPEVTAMKGCPQPPEFHREGDVFQHTKLALETFQSTAWQEFFGDSRPSLNTIISVLLHDIGKPLTIKTPEADGTDRIRTNEHDIVGAKLVPEICERLKLTSYTDNERGQAEPDTVSWLVQHHLLLVHGSPKDMRPATIYRYFLKNPDVGLTFQQLIFADSASTLPADGRDLTESLRLLRTHIALVAEKLNSGKLMLLLTGTDIINTFKIEPGPKVGELLRLLEEAQLEGKVHTKDEAAAYLKNLT